jgi:hypothetical protein
MEQLLPNAIIKHHFGFGDSDFGPLLGYPPRSEPETGHVTQQKPNLVESILKLASCPLLTLSAKIRMSIAVCQCIAKYSAFCHQKACISTINGLYSQRTKGLSNLLD